MDAFFADVRPSPHSTSAGPCDLPILYRDSSLLELGYRVAPDRARALVPPSLTPWVVLGKAVAILCIFEYRETTIGPYGEIGVGVLAHRAGRSPSLWTAARDLAKEEEAGLYVVNLPVSSEGARAAGVELWGYPKYVSPIETSFRPDGVRAVLGDEFELTIGGSRGIGAKGLPLVTFSIRNGRLIRTTVPAEQPARWGGRSSVRMVLKGEGPTATTLRSLGLDRARPLFAYRTDHLRSILGLGTDMGEAKA